MGEGAGTVPEPSSATAHTRRTDLAGSLAQRFADWAAEPFPRHLLAVLLLALVAAVRWWQQVFDPQPQNDEMIYFAAFDAVVAGSSPFTVSGYLAFSTLAYVGAWLLDIGGQTLTLTLFRSANLVGLGACVWLSSAWLTWVWSKRLLACVLFVALAPAVGFGVELGNLSLLMAGMVVFALLSWPRQPLLAGSLLGLSVAVKPVAPAAIVALLFHRPDRAGRRHLVTGGVALAVSGLIVLASPHLGSVWSKEIWFRLARTVSPYRFAHLLDLRGSEPIVFGLVLLLTAVIARQWVLGPTQCYAIAATAAIAATPVVWSHTLLITLPLQALALAVLHVRWSAGRGSDKPGSLRIEAVLVILAVAAIQTAEGATNIYDQHLLIQWLGAVPPVIAPAALTGYLIRHTAAF